MSPAPLRPASARALRRRDAVHVRDAALGPSMTPMVDVTLVILVFFMASTTFLGPEWLLRTALWRQRHAAATGASSFSLPPARFELTLHAGGDGHTLVDGLGLTGATLTDAAARLGDYARRLGPDHMTVVVSPAPEVPYRDVVRIHEACAALGIDGVGLE